MTRLSYKTVHNFLLPLLLFFLVATLFGPALKLPLLSDDYIWVRDISAFDTLSHFFKETFALKESDFRYRPLMPTAIRLCYQISGSDPFCMHLVGFILHFLNILLTGKLIYLLTKNRLSLWAAMFFFAVYFPHVVNVIWPSDLGNLLAVFFMLNTAIFFILFITSHNYFLWMLSGITFALAMISKESALALGPILITWSLIIFWKRPPIYNHKRAILAGSGYILLMGTYVLLINRTGLNFAFSGTGNYSYHWDLSTLRNALYYPLNFIWPTEATVLEIIYQNLFDLSRTHTGGVIDFLKKAAAIPGLIWVGVGTLAIWVGVVWLLWRGYFVDWVALIWTIFGILPVIFLAGHGERHLYVASVGLSLLVGHLFFKKSEGKRDNVLNLRYLGSMIFVVILAGNFYWSQIRVQDWQTAGSIASDTISSIMTYYPDLSGESELWFVNLPPNFNTAHLFRLGIDAALQLEIDDRGLVAHNLSHVDQLPATLNAHQYAFIFKDGQLVDLTPEYRQ